MPEKTFESAYRLTPEQRAREREMMLSPERWPVRPVLHVKRRAVGVRDTVMGTLNEVRTARGDFSVNTGFNARRPYESVDAVLDDGWVVD